MKKLLILSTLLLVGCGRTLTCTNESKDGDAKQKVEVIIKFDENIPKSMTTNITFSTSSSKDLENYKNNFKNSIEKENIDGEITSTDDSVTLTFSEEYNNDANIISGTNDYENIKEYFSNNGYICR